MQTAASPSKIATGAWAALKTVDRPSGHKRARGQLHLPWQFNMIAASLIATGIGVWLIL